MTDHSKGVVLRTGAKIAGIVPTSIEEVFRLATAVAKSGLAPKGMNTPEALTVAIMQGMEIGLPPMMAINKIAVVNGRPTLWGDAIPALLWANGFKLREWIDGDSAHCEVTRPTGEVIERKFSTDDARKAGLWGKQGPWAQYPDRMKAMRARGFASRDGAPDVLGGLYIAEEIEPQLIIHHEARDITPRPPKLDLPDIPDISPAHTDETEIPSEIDPDMVLDHLRLALQHCDDTEEWALICESNEDDIAMLPATYQIKARRMLAEAAP